MAAQRGHFYHLREHYYFKEGQKGHYYCEGAQRGAHLLCWGYVQTQSGVLRGAITVFGALWGNITVFMALGVHYYCVGHKHGHFFCVRHFHCLGHVFSTFFWSCYSYGDTRGSSGHNIEGGSRMELLKGQQDGNFF